MCSFSRLIWKMLHLIDIFYTGTARGARDKYEVCTLQSLQGSKLKVYTRTPDETQVICGRACSCMSACNQVFAEDY